MDETVTTEKPSLLPQFDPNQNYGFFGYRGTMCDLAIRRDNAEMLAECLELEFFEPDAELLNPSKTVRSFCKEIAPRCFAMLEERAPA